MQRQVSGESGSVCLVGHRLCALWFRSADIGHAILHARGVHATNLLLSYAACLSRVTRPVVCLFAAYTVFADRLVDAEALVRKQQVAKSPVEVRRCKASVERVSSFASSTCDAICRLCHHRSTAARAAHCVNCSISTMSQQTESPSTAFAEPA